jgi:hypothetical protein
MVASGAYYPCAGWQGYAVGDLRTRSLKEIWTSSPQLQYLRSIKRGDFPACQACPDQNYCAMSWYQPLVDGLFAIKAAEFSRWTRENFDMLFKKRQGGLS